MAREKAVFLAASLDVEEEGLFSGHYEIFNVSVKNTDYLTRLVPLVEHGLKPTLFCAYSVLTNSASLKNLENICGKFAVEIGAHLHHWNTPPLAGEMVYGKGLRKVPADEVKNELFERKIANLFRVAKEFSGSPATSFRMGRWDMHRHHWNALARYGVKCDASIRPLHSALRKEDGPDHFAAPMNPYIVKTAAGNILEVPLTVVPILPWVTGIPKVLRPSLKNWGILPLLPVQYPLWLLKFITRRYISSGGRVISLTWHSSEMMPGGAPHMPDKQRVSSFINKLGQYLEWLDDNYQVQNATMRELPEYFPSAPAMEAPGSDWCVA